MKRNQKPMTETEVRRLLVRYQEADLAKMEAYAASPCGIETHKAFALADRRWVAFHKAAQDLLGHRLSDHDRIIQFVEDNPLAVRQ